MANTCYCKLTVHAGLSTEKVMEWLGDDEVEHNEEEQSYGWTSRGEPCMTSVVQLHVVHGGYFTFSYEDVLANVLVELSFKPSPTHTEIYEEDIAVDTEEFPLGEPLKWLPF